MKQIIFLLRNFVQKKYPIRIRYLEGRSVNSRMRGVLLDWLIEVHTQFGFMPETLYLATKILDRYLQVKNYHSWITGLLIFF